MALPTQTVVHKIEQFATPLLESVVNHESVGIGFGLVNRVQGTLSRTVERGSRRVMHAFNLPAASDINRILTQVAALERTVRTLNNNVEDVLHEENR